MPPTPAKSCATRRSPIRRSSPTARLSRSFVTIDKDAKTLTIADNGIGMSQDDLDACARHDREFRHARLSRTAEAADAAKERRAREGGGHGAAQSDRPVRHRLLFGFHGRRSGRCRDAPGGPAAKPGPGVPTARAPSRSRRWRSRRRRRAARASFCISTRRPSEYLEPSRLEQIVTRTFGAVAVPIDLVETPGAEAAPPDRGLARSGPSRRAPITAQEYAEFYRGLAGQFDEPALTMHWRAEGRHEYTRARLRSGLAAARSFRSRAQGPRQALCPPCPDHRRMPIFCRAGCVSSASSSIRPICRSTSRAR